MDIVVLYGGLSKERDVSFSSGIGVAGRCGRRGTGRVMDVFFGYLGNTRIPANSSHG